MFFFKIVSSAYIVTFASLRKELTNIERKSTSSLKSFELILNLSFSFLRMKECILKLGYKKLSSSSFFISISNIHPSPSLSPF